MSPIAACGFAALPRDGPRARVESSHTDRIFGRGLHEYKAYGIVAPATHEELRRLYEHAEHDLGGRYLPEAVLVQTLDGKLRPALCYIAPEMEQRPADKEYLDRIVGPAKEYRFPDWYIARLESFRV